MSNLSNFKLIPILNNSYIENTEGNFFHGTSIENLTKIVNSGKIGTEYFDGVGIYLTKCCNVAMNHGNYIICFSSDSINKVNLQVNEEEKEFFHSGYIDISKIKFIAFIMNSKTFYNDILIKMLKS